MKNLFSILIAAVIGHGIIGCSEDKIVEIRENQDFTSISFNRSIEEALKDADDWFAQMGFATRSEGRTIKSVETLVDGVSTRSQSPDSLLYLINYDNNEGFALIGVHSDSRGLYAISETGSLEMSDTIKNKGLAAFFAAAKEDAKLADITIPGGSFVGDVIKVITRHQMPMLNENVAKWSQEAPFNSYCPIVGGKRGVVGCAPLAVGMLMSYYQWPEKINGRAIPWESIITDNNYDEIARLLETLASSEYLGATYLTNDGSLRGAEPSKIIPSLKKSGYQTAGCFDLTDFDANRTIIFDFMLKGEGSAKRAPVLMNGYVGTNTLGHAFIVDGFAVRYWALRTNPDVRFGEADPLLHVIWGMGGKCNGHYTYLRSKKVINSTSDTSGVEAIGDEYGSLGVCGKIWK